MAELVCEKLIPQVNDRKRKRPYDTGDPLVHPFKRLEKRECGLTSSGEHTVGEIKKKTSTDVPRVAEPVNSETLRSPPISSQHHSPNLKRRHPEPEHPSYHPNHLSKRLRVDRDNLIEHWVNNYEWPKSPLKIDMEDLLARPKTPSLRRTKSNASLNVPSEISSRETKSRPYTDKNYEIYLETKGSYMGRHKDSITKESKDMCQKLLMKEAKIPRDTVFKDDAFESTCERLSKYNETGIIRIIGGLIVPSAESAIDLGHVAFPHFVVSVNEAWDSSISLDESPQLPPTLLSSQAPQAPQAPQPRHFRLPRPQPDYAAGFPRQRFTETQLKKLAPFVGDIGDTSFFMSTAYMYFPFLTAEVKCGKAALDIADRQNGHSSTIEVRGVVKLFRALKREKELHRQILAFSISHDHRMVRIYGHYPVIDGEKTTYHRHSVHEFSFAALDGREKWTSYKFVIGLYDDWAPSHFRRLCSAIDELPEVNFQVSQQPEISQQSELSFSESTGLSQGIEGVDVQGSSFTSVPGEETQPTLPDSQIAPSQVTQGNEGKSPEALKVSKKRRK